MVPHAVLGEMNMNRCGFLLLAFVLGISLPAYSSAQTNSDVGSTGVALTLIRFDVNDQSLSLACKVTNNGEQDIWVCDGITAFHPNSNDYEAYLADDCRTLTIRRRLEVAEEIPGIAGWFRGYQARYRRLHPGQNRTWSFTMAVPVKPNFILMGYPNKADYATCLSVEIGICDGDLPGRIADIIGLAERLDTSYRNDVVAPNYELFDRYFSGFRIADAFGGSAGFRDRYEPGSDQITIDRAWPWETVSLFGERPLNITIDGIFIAYESGS